MAEHLLKNGTFNRDDAAHRFGVSVRTISNDLDGLKEHGWEIEYDRGRNSYVVIREGDAVAGSEINSVDWLALHTAARLCRTRGLDSIADRVQQVADRYQARVPDAAAAARAEEAEVIVMMPGAAGGSPIPYFDLLSAAARDGYWVQIRYRGPDGRETERRVDPYRILVFGSVAYLFGWCHARTDFRQFRLDRIQGLDVVEETFRRLPETEVDRFVDALMGPWGDGGPCTVRVRFSAWVAQWVRGQRWHASQIDHELPDDRLEFELTVSGTRQIAWNVLSYGGEAEVVEPEALRRQVREMGEKIIAVHGGSRA